jgi:hypothetical protein
MQIAPNFESEINPLYAKIERLALDVYLQIKQCEQKLSVTKKQKHN